MSKIPQEVIKELIKSQKFNNTQEVMQAIKEMFKDVLQEIMEAELESELGYEKQEKRSENVEHFTHILPKSGKKYIRQTLSKDCIGSSERLLRQNQYSQMMTPCVKYCI